MQPDPFAGIPTRPISQNPYPYAYDNPLIYTDASGWNPIAVLAAGIVGGIGAGVVAGSVGSQGLRVLEELHSMKWTPYQDLGGDGMLKRFLEQIPWNGFTE